jgi:hypothetical protein
MPAKIIKPNFAQTDLQLEPFLPDLSVEDLLQRAISFGYGWHSTSERWKALLADADGRLLVSTSATQAATGSFNNSVVGTTAAAVLGENLTRRQFVIQNLGTVPIYLGYTSSLTTSNGLQIPVNGVWIDDKYVGAVYLISGTAAQDIRYQEI